jgi:phosphinothricin acetyltransferase
MSEILIRTVGRGDLAWITEIYNYYVLDTPVTFDVEACTVERREAWFEQFNVTGRNRKFGKYWDVCWVERAG